MIAENIANFLTSADLEILKDQFEEFDEETFFSLTHDLINVMVRNTYHAAKLSIKLGHHRAAANAGLIFVQPQVTAGESLIPTTKEEIIGIRDVDLQCILKRSNKDYVMTATEENDIVCAIIKHTLSKNYDARITADDYEKCASAICEIFPAMQPAVFFVKPNAGKLYMKMVRYRYKMGHYKLIVPREYVKKPKDDESPEILVEETKNVMETEEISEISASSSRQAALENLYIAVDPWTTIVRDWKATFELRKDVLAASESVHGYLSKFPCLENQKGLELLALDAYQLFELEFDHFSLNWPQMAVKLIEIVKTTPVGRNVAVKRLLDLLPSEADDKSKQVVALLLLPHMLPTTVLKKKSSNLKYSKLEVQEDFVSHHETSAGFRTAMAKLWDNGGVNQPTMAIIGSKSTQLSAEIVLTTRFFPIDDPLKAIVLLMKAYYALNCKFPEKSKKVWTFMSQFVFEIETKERASSTLIALKNKLMK